MQDFLKKLVWTSGLIACFGLMFLSLSRIDRQRTFIPQAMDSFYLPSEQVLKLASLGYRRMAADLLWVKTLMYFGEELAGPRRQTWLAAHARRVVTLDPSFELAYTWAGAAMLYGGRVIDNETVLLSNEFYRAGMKRFPDNWRFPAALAFNLVYEYRTDDPEIQERHRTEAIELFERASRMEGAPPYLKLFTITQMTRAGLNQLAVEYVKEAYASAQDEEERKLLARRLQDLEKGDHALELQWHHEQTDKMFRLSLSYGSQELFFLLGPRPENIEPDGSLKQVPVPEPSPEADHGGEADVDTPGP